MRRAACFLLLALGCGPAAVRPADRPHVVVIVVDDVGQGDLGYCGGDLDTPRLDALANESLRLDRFYAAPMCSPSRAQLMTGKHALRLGMLRNIKPDDDAGLSTDETTVAERLAEAGYRAALVGKWHLGHARPEQRPNARGFQASYGLLRGWVDYTTHEVDGVTDWHRNGAPLDEPGYATDLIAAEAVRVIHAHDPSAPLFLVVSFNAPHPPLQAPPGAAPGSDARAVYAAMVERMDTRIGDVLDALDASGLAQNTLLWFLSDNGANPKFGGSNAPLAGGKYTCYEGGLRVPALLRWPGHLSPGASAAFVATVDLAPSLEALAGLARRSDVDGIDVLPALQAGLATPERDLLFAVDHANVERRAILRAPWKYITERRKDGTTLQLFNVVADPLEEHDLARQSPEIASALAARLAEASPAAAPRGQ